jgi:prolyl-tRNA synthetase
LLVDFTQPVLRFLSRESLLHFCCTYLLKAVQVRRQLVFLLQAFVPNTGRGIQGATSHCLGQNFAKMFDIRFEDEKGKRSFVWQNSWAYSTRSVILIFSTCS